MVSRGSNFFKQVVPQWLANKLPCYKVMVAKWVSDGYKAEHAACRARRLLLGEGHRQGGLTLTGIVQREVNNRFNAMFFVTL